MATTVLEQIRKLDEQKAKLIDDARQEALRNAEAAIAELNALGFNYRLVEGGGASRTQRTTPSGRRSGIREDVLSAVQNGATTPAAVRDALGIQAGDKSGAQSVSNALSALRRAGKIRDQGGSYVAA